MEQTVKQRPGFAITHTSADCFEGVLDLLCIEAAKHLALLRLANTHKFLTSTQDQETRSERETVAMSHQ